MHKPQMEVVSVTPAMANDAETNPMRPALELVLLFHGAGPWTEDKAAKWEAVTERQPGEEG